ncbi:MAG TPA: hypothetical protein VFJ05_01015 [Nitrososphaeraceae archaeon]|nr:hypothetical protein [Nitrososphaeraceae archaeon]
MASYFTVYSCANAVPSCPVLSQEHRFYCSHKGFYIITSLHKNSELTHSNLISEYKLQTFKSNEKSVRLMLNKRETVLSALVVVSVILVASSFAISFVEQALAQVSNMSSGVGNATSAGSNMSNPATSGGQMTGGY